MKKVKIEKVKKQSLLLVNKLFHAFTRPLFHLHLTASPRSFPTDFRGGANLSSSGTNRARISSAATFTIRFV